MNNHEKLSAWFREHNGETFNPEELVDVISHYRDHNIGTYCFLEEKGHIVPMAYKHGEVSKVRLFFPKLPEKLTKIESDNKLKQGSLTQILYSVYEHITVRENAIRLPRGVRETLIQHHYLKRPYDDMVCLGKVGRKFVDSRV